MSFLNQWPIAALVVLLLGLMFLANELGLRIGRSQQASESERALNVSGILKGSVLGLVGLLLGFSFSLTSNRFDMRQRIVLDEANAVGTCFLRAGLLEEPARGRIRGALRAYTDARIEYFDRALESGVMDRTSREMDTALTELWSGVEVAVKANLALAHSSQIVPAANQVIDMAATRGWSTRTQMPAPMILLLAACAIVSSGLMGHSSGQAGRRHLGLWISLNVLVMLIFSIVLDFDRPRRGFIRVNHAPFYELRESIKP